MKLPLLATLVLVTALSSCATIKQSRFNPMNWHRHSRAVGPVTLYTPPTETRALVSQVLTLKVEPFPGGVIVRASGLPPTQGYWDAALVAQPVDDKGRLVFEFRIFPPITPTAPGTPYSRQVTVAVSLSDIRLNGVTSIVVQGDSNALSVRQ
ncbi:MAG: hypothetical protein ABIV25_03050 [Paracoccaceae bacterium]